MCTTVSGKSGSFLKNSPKKMATFIKIQANINKVNLSEKGEKAVATKLQKACKTRWLSFEQSVRSIKKVHLPSPPGSKTSWTRKRNSWGVIQENAFQLLPGSHLSSKRGPSHSQHPEQDLPKGWAFLCSYQREHQLCQGPNESAATRAKEGWVHREANFRFEGRSSFCDNYWADRCRTTAIGEPESKIRFEPCSKHWQEILKMPRRLLCL